MTTKKCFIVSVLGLTLLSSGCGGGSGATSAPDGQVQDRQTVTASPARDSCGGIAGTVEQHIRRAAVESVTVAGQCTSVSVETGLDDGETAAAKRICEAAAEVAYSGDTNAIRVLGRSGKELAIGVAGAGCLVEP